MRTKIRLTVLFFQLLVLPGLFAAPAADTAVRRFGFFVGANDGGPQLETLRYAVRDADSLSRLFRNMGGIKPQDNVFLVEPSLAELQGKLRTLQEKIGSLRSMYSRMELVFYYSGHSDEEGILLSKDKFTYKELKDMIRSIPVDMRVVILDSCSSGALTKLKGGAKKPAFLTDNSIKMEGYAIMTSSSSDEVSQESDSLKGSYFTYALISGLRGAADTRGNKRVTLNQAYQYAYQETLAKTERTLGGAQHPNYDIRMNGSGDVVLTDLRETTASLKLDADLSGRVNIRDDSGVLMTEINKTEGSTVELGLEPGAYLVSVDKDKKNYLGNITVRENERAVFSKSLLALAETEKTVSRGKPDKGADRPSLETSGIDNRANYITIPFALSIIPVFSTTSKTIVNFQLNIGAGYCDRLEGTSVGFVNIAGEDAKYLDLSLVSVTAHDFTGFEGTLVSFTGHDFMGGQAALVNVVGHDFSSVQGGLVNVIGHDFSSVQAGLVNLIGNDFSGVQVGLVNCTVNRFTGVQAGLVNMNIGSFEGPQVGFVNYNTMTKGLQIGLVNVSAGMDGASIGLVSVVLSNGQTHGELWIDETGFLNVALIHGSKFIYNIYRVGMDLTANFWSYGLGLGVHLPLDPFSINIEAVNSCVSRIDKWDGMDSLSQLRVYAGFSFFDHFSVIAGLAANFYCRWTDQAPDIGPVYSFSKSYNNNFRMWPGIFAGLEF